MAVFFYFYITANNRNNTRILFQCVSSIEEAHSASLYLWYKILPLQTE